MGAPVGPHVEAAMSDTPAMPTASGAPEPDEQHPFAGEQTQQPDPQQNASDEGRRSPLRLLAPLALIAAILLMLTVALAHQGPTKHELPNNATRTSSATFAGGTLTPLTPAPPIDLRNYRGQRVTLSEYRGKVVLVTFLYTHCPDVCPLIASNLHAVQTRLAQATRNVQIISVSVDPRGDTPKTVGEFLRVHDMTDRMQYLLGSARQLGRTWKAWHVGSENDASNPELVAHSGLVYGVSASGRLTTVYPANFKPADIAHDVP